MRVSPQLLMGLGLAVLAVVAPLAFGSNPYLLGLVVSAFIIAGVALAWALLGNLGGMISFGHAAFFGVGAYGSALLATKAGLPVALAIPLGGAAAVAASFITMPALRLVGPYFSLAMLAYAEIFRILATEFSGVTNGAAGLARIPPLPAVSGVDLSSRLGSYYVLVAALALSALVYWAIRRSHYGTALRAMGESEDATRVVGVNSTLLKAAMLMASAFITGVFGALNAHIINFLDPDYAFSGTWTLLPIVAAVFGGYRSLAGPVVGAVVIYLFDQLLAKAFIPLGHQILLGFVLAGMILLAPNGLVPLALNAAGRHAER